MNRGDRREAIFADDKARQCLVETPEQAFQKAGWRGSSSSTSAPVPSWCPGSHPEEYDNLINRPLHAVSLKTRDCLCRTTSRQPMTADGCSFSQGEKVRMRASHEEFCLASGLTSGLTLQISRCGLLLKH